MDNSSVDKLEYAKYMFDLQGYFIVENVLSISEIEKLNQILDKKLPKSQGLGFRNVGYRGLGILDTCFFGYLVRNINIG